MREVCVISLFLNIRFGEYNLASSCDSYSATSFFFFFYIYVGCCATDR